VDGTGGVFLGALGPLPHHVCLISALREHGAYSRGIGRGRCRRVD